MTIQAMDDRVGERHVSTVTSLGGASLAVVVGSMLGIGNGPIDPTPLTSLSVKSGVYWVSEVA